MTESSERPDPEQADETPMSRRELRAERDREAPADGAPNQPDDADADDAKKGPGCVKVGCLTLLAMVLITALAVGGFAGYLWWKLDSNVQREALLPGGGNQPTRDKAAGDAKNILLLGSDSLTKNLRDASRADVIQLVHISNDKKSVQVVHFPRDLFVDIPGHGKNKINAAFAYGGTPLLVQTIQNLLDVKIDHAAIIGFEGFAKLTDTVGGVELNVTQRTSKWDVGRHKMNGKEALAFVRERKQLREGDIDRGRNQQRWISAVMAKTLTAGTLTNPAKINRIVDDVTGDGNLSVDNDMNVAGLGFSMRNLRMRNVTFYTAPFSGFGTDKTAGSIDIVDEAKMKSLGTALRKDDFSTYSGEPNSI